MFDAGDFEAALVIFDAALLKERTTRALYAKGQTLAKLGRCAEALSLYDEVLERLPKDAESRKVVEDALQACNKKVSRSHGITTLTLLAKAKRLDEDGRCDEATTVYEEILSTMKQDAPARPSVEKALQVCREEQPARTSSVPPVPPTSAPPSPPSDAAEPSRDRSGPSPVGWSGAAGTTLGVALCAGGAVLLARKETSIEVDADGRRSQLERQPQRTAGFALLATGGVVATTGLILLIYDGVRRRERRNRSVAMVPQINAASPGVALTGRF